MKSFLKTVLLYVGVLTILTALINYVYITRCESTTKKYKDVPYEIQICNFGSSHGLNGFNYIDQKEHICFNFALASQYPSYDYRILKYYSNHLNNEGGIVFLPISYFSLFGPRQEMTADFESKNRRYYDFLPAELIKQYNVKTKFFECYFPSLIANEKLFTSLYPKDDDDWSMITTPEQAESYAPLRYQTHVKECIDKDGRRIYNHEEIYAVYEMIELCRSHNQELILITTPYLHEYPDFIKRNDPDFFEDFYALISEIQANTGVRYYDFSTDDRFSHNYKLFMNVDHLNREGARLFTNILIQESLNHAI